MIRWGRLEISGGFLLLAATLYYLDVQNLLPWAAAAALLHELGHYGAIRLLGGRVALLRLTCVGAEMVLSARRPLTETGRLLTALAGPGVNLLLALIAARLASVWGEQAYLFAGLNLGLGAFNLLPVAQLDGGRALGSLLTLLWSETLAQCVVRVCSFGLSAALLLAGGVLTATGSANITLLITALWLFSVSASKQRCRPAVARSLKSYTCKG